VDRRGEVTAAALAARLRAAPPRLGRTRLVCVDGPAGSGKTTLAGRLAGTLGPGTGLVHMDDLYAGWTLTGAAARLAAALGTGAAVLHMDDLYAGWTLTGAAARLAAGVLRPLAEGRPGAYHRYDWAAGRFAAEPTPVPPPPVLLVEGCGSAPAALDPWTTLRIWVEAPAALRLARGLARDGAALEPQWRRWQEHEAAWFAADRTRERAQLHLDTTAGAEPDRISG
jgi:uridine kinase